MTDEKVIKSQQEFTIPLKNGNIVKLTKEDILQNNIQKLRDQIPDLKIADQLSDKNPFKKIMQTLESGIQNKQPYYKWLSVIILGYIWLIQGLALYHHSPSANAMLFITLWATYAIIRLQVKPDLEVNTLKDIILNDSSKIYIKTSIFASLLIVLILYTIVNIDTPCARQTEIKFANIINFHSSFYIYPISAISSIIVLICTYNPYSFYENYILRIDLSHTTSMSFLLSSVFLGILLYYFYVYAFPICYQNFEKFLYVATFFSLYALSFFCATSCTIFIILALRKASKFFNKP